MAETNTPQLPPGFVLDGNETPPLPPGFQVEGSGGVASVLQQPFQGFNEVFSDIVGAPGDIVNPVVRGLGGGNVLPGSRDLRDVFVQGPEPQNIMERGLRRGGQVAMETAALSLPMGKMLQNANAALPAVAAPQAGIRETLTRGMADAPQAKGAALDLLSGFSSGVAEQAGRELSGGDENVALWSALGGGFAPNVIGVTPTAMTLKAVNGVRGRFSPVAQQDQARKYIGDIVGNNLTEGEATGVARGQELKRDIPGFEPSIAEASKSPALGVEQAALETRMSGPELEKAVQRRLANAEAVEQYAMEHAPQSRGVNVDGVIDAATGRVLTTSGHISRSQHVIKEKRVALGDFPDVDKAETGHFMREGVFEARKARQDEMNALSEELGLNNIDVTAEARAGLEAIIAKHGKLGLFDDPDAIPEVVDGIKNVLKRTDGEMPVTFEDVKGLRERVSDDLIDAMSGTNPKRKKIRNLVALKKDVDDFIANLEFDGSPDLSANYKQFRDTYFNEYVAKFEDGGVFKVRQNNARGFYQTEDERVASVFFGPNTQSATRQYVEMFGDNPEQMAALYDSALDDLRKFAVDADGTINPARFRAWKTRHENTMRETPEFKAKIDNIEEANNALLQRNAELDARSKVLESSALFKELAKVDNLSKTPEEAIANLFKDPRRLSQLMKRLPAGSPARIGLQRHIWDQVNNLPASGMRKFLDDNDAVLKIVYRDNPQHITNLRKINDAMQMIEAVPDPHGTRQELSSTVEFFEDKLGFTPQLAANRFFQVHSRIVGPKYAASDLFARTFKNRSRRSIDAVLTEALYDVDLAEDLAAIALQTKGASPRTMKQMHTWLFTLGIEDEQNATQ